MHMRFIAAVALGVAAMASMTAGAQQMYRWVDKNGKINYTQDPPPKDAAKSVQQRRLNSSGPAEGSQQIPFAVRQAMDNFPVTLYTSPECAQGCKEAKDLLARRGVPYREVSIADQASSDTLKKVTGDTRVPAMQVGRALEKGFEEGAYNAALDLAGYPRTSQFTGKPPVLSSPKPAAKPAAAVPAEPPVGAPEGATAPSGASEAPPPR